MKPIEPGNHTSATILRFSRKRGRPKSARLGSDSGTPELVMKRLLGETAETLDLCLERGIITIDQHWCGIHLRWLYTLRHGAPGIRAIDTTHIGGIDLKLDDPDWRNARELEFHEAMNKLAPSGYAPLIMNMCIYNERPKFLSLRQRITAEHANEATDMIEGLRGGLDILAKLWGRNTKGKK